MVHAVHDAVCDGGGDGCVGNGGRGGVLVGCRTVFQQFFCSIEWKTDTRQGGRGVTWSPSSLHTIVTSCVCV